MKTRRRSGEIADYEVEFETLGIVAKGTLHYEYTPGELPDWNGPYPGIEAELEDATFVARWISDADFQDAPADDAIRQVIVAEFDQRLDRDDDFATRILEDVLKEQGEL